ncbi:MAG TPA: DUF2723 domain-containing protein, partial [Candidatus Altiarchaeales archaeon]|nr:DUF2723 domain-containing protein [Candidatus Altiarchaeales archaeon]
MDYNEFILKNRKYLIPLILFLLAFTPRAYYMNDGLFHTDSVFQAIALEGTVDDLHFTYKHPPGYPGQVVAGSIVYVFFKIFTGAQNAETAATFTSVLTGSLAVVAMYFFAKEFLESEKSGMYAAILLSFTPVFLSVTTYAKSHGTEILFLLLSAYYAVVAGKTGGDRHKILAGFCLGYSTAVRVTSVIFTPILFLTYWSYRPPLSFKRSESSLKVMLGGKPSEVLKDAAKLLLPSIIVPVILYLPQTLSKGLKPFEVISTRANFLGLFSPMLSQSIEWISFSFKSVGWIFMAAGLI